MNLNQETMDAFKDLLGQHTSELKKEFNDQVREIKKDNTDLKREFNEQVRLIKKDNADNAEQIKGSITGLSNRVAKNTENIGGISDRIGNIEKEVREIQNKMAQVEQGPSGTTKLKTHIAQTNETHMEMQERFDNTRADITSAARKIVGITPVSDDDIERTSNPILPENEKLYFAAIEFLHLELGYTEEQCHELDIIKVTRPRAPNTNKLYIHFGTEKSAEYLHRMVRAINSRIPEDDENPRPNSKMFIPPQLHNRYADICKICYDKRQVDKNCKTRISLGEEDLVLEIKKQGEQWHNVDINTIGQISPPEWHKVWPIQKTPYLSDLPRGRYSSQKRGREEYSTDEGEFETHNEGKKKRDKSPVNNIETTQTNGTGDKNNDTDNEEDTTNTLQDPYEESVQQKIVRANIFWDIFQGKSKKDENTTGTGSKNGGTTKGKGARIQARKPKGGKE